MNKLDVNEFELIRNYIKTNCGIDLDNNKMYLIENRLTPLVAENGCTSYSEFYYKAKNDPTNRLKEKIIDAMTTNETLWFRDSSPFTTLNDHLFPLFEKEITSGIKFKIRIWSAACSSGQEPYSIAMTILEYCQIHRTIRPEHFEIIATDISPTVLFIAKAARYDSHIISRGLSDTYRNKYFSSDGKIWKLNDNVKQMVQFSKLNLQDPFNNLGKMDIVFCRNVLIYFSEDLKRDLLKRIAALLQPSGFLYLGASESISNYSNDYSLKTFNKSLYYQVR